MSTVLSRQTYALVVAVSTSGLGQDWHRAELLDDGQRFVDWLKDRGVPNANITFLRGDEVTAARMLDVVPNLNAGRPQDRFWMYWAGHGVVKNKELRLLLSDARRGNATNLQLSRLLDYLRSDAFSGALNQKIIVDACQHYLDDVQIDNLNDPIGLPTGSERRDITQKTWLATEIGKGAFVVPKGGGLFSAAVLQSLRQSDSVDVEPGSREELSLLMQELDASGNAFQTPTSVIYEDATGNREPIEFVPASLTGHHEPTSLSAWHLPSDWIPGDPRPAPGDAYPARIDVLWGLDRGPFRGVLADRADGQITPALSWVEHSPLSEATNPTRELDAFHVPRRSWFVLPDDDADETPAPPRTATTLEQAVAEPTDLAQKLAQEPGGGLLGLVVSCAQGHRRFQQPSSTVNEVLALGSVWPAAAIVVLVTADPPEPALSVAAGIGSGLRSVRSDRANIAPTVLTKVLPSAESVTPEPAPISSVEELLLGSSASRDAVDPTVWNAAETLDTLVNQGISLSELTARLLDVRDARQPTGVFVQLLSHYAKYGMDPARYAALAAAVSRDKHVDCWIGGAGAERPPDPDVLPAGLLREEGIDALVLGLLRSENPVLAETVSRWRLLATKSVQLVADHLVALWPQGLDAGQRDVADRTFLLGFREVSAAHTALRAGVGSRLSVRDLSPDGLPSAAAWALMARRRLDHDTVSLIETWPLSHRRVLGFTTLDEGRAEPDAQAAERFFAVTQFLRPQFRLRR